MEQIFALAASKYILPSILQWITEHGSSPQFARARDMKSMVTTVITELVREKADALLQGKGSRDIMSLLGMSSSLDCCSAMLTILQ